MTRSLHRLSFALILLPALGCGVQSMPLYTETDAGAAAGGQGGGQGGTGAGQTGGSGGSAGAQGGSGGSAGASGGTGGTAGTSGGTGGSAGASGGTGGPAGQGGVGGTYEVGEGESCGGFRPAPAPVCGKGLFCEMPAASCNIADAPGKCALVTSICPAIYNPVCGCDGKTYGSDCERRANRAQLAHQGECKRRVAQEGEMCAGIAGIQCADGLLCDPAPGLCKAADAGGTCKRFTPACTKEYAPVCGCDGNTYGNDCMRLNAKVGKKADGACERRSTTLAPGQWGGVGARLLVKDPNAGAAFELDCAHGTIDGPLEVTPDGQFKWKATLILEGGPVQDPPQPGRTRAAIFTGKTAGDTLSLQVIVDNAFAPPPALILTLGKEALLRKCL